MDRVERVNAPLSRSEEEAMARSLRRSQPLGTPGWPETTIRRLGLESTKRPQGRPPTQKTVPDAFVTSWDFVKKFSKQEGGWLTGRWGTGIKCHS